MPDNRCSNCVQYGYECTHKEVTKVCKNCPLCSREKTVDILKTLGSAKGYEQFLKVLDCLTSILTRPMMSGVDMSKALRPV